MQKEAHPYAHEAQSSSLDLIKEIKTHEDGLTSLEAQNRIKKYGHNTLAKKKKRSSLILFLSRFKSPLIIILIFAAIISAYFNELTSAIIITLMILLSAVLDFALEYRAEKASQKLKEHLKTTVSVLRDKEQKEIPLSDIVPGDIVMLRAGDIIPADGRIVAEKDFFVSQASLTGESLPMEKTALPLSSSPKSLGDLKNMVFMGTSVVSGTASILIIRTGKDTEYGKIAQALIAPQEETDFDKGIKSFGYLITKVIIFLVLFIFLVRAIAQKDILESFLFALAVAVGLTPELLPMVMSVTMAKGSMNMAKKGVIVKRLSCIPSFGSMDILCTDKTGTLTEDKISVVAYTDPFGKKSEKTLFYSYLTSIYQTGIENPLDNAVLNLKTLDVKGYKKIDEIPFNFLKRKMSVIVSKDSSTLLITKGAPEEIFKFSSKCQVNGRSTAFSSSQKKKALAYYNKLSSQGYKVLAVAYKPVSSKANFEKEDSSKLELLGYISFLDPPKKDVGKVISEMSQLGIEVKILTGDNELVTKKICSEINLPVKGVLLGSDLDEMTDDALKIRAQETTIFARVSPEQKTRIIRALKSNGLVVGYLGDGINDATALKSADVGISVKSAVDVAKESADIVLTRKNLLELKEGVIEGRKTFGNTMKYILMGISSNFGNMLSVAAATLFLPFLPMLPLQILLNNFMYDASQVTIPTDRVDPEFIKKPKHWDMKFIKQFMIVFGIASTIFDLLTFYILFQFSPAVFQTGWFIESLATQALVIHVIRTNKTPFFKSRSSLPVLISSIAVVVLGIIIPFTLIGPIFGFVPLPLHVLAIIAVLVIIYLIIVEVTKVIFYKRHNL